MLIKMQTWFESRGVRLHWAIALTLLLSLLYIALQIIFLGEPLVDLFGFLFALLALLSLRSAGLSLRECYLTFAPLSKRWAGRYLALLLIYLAILVPVGGEIHLDWMSLLILAPLTALVQELFFRSALLPALRHAFQGKFGPALWVHSVLFAIWHAGVFATGAPLGAAFMVVLIPFLYSLAWGIQTQQDGTVLWTFLHHALLQMIMRLFTWG